MNPYDESMGRHMGCKSPVIGAIPAYQLLLLLEPFLEAFNWDLWGLPGPTFVPQSRIAGTMCCWARWATVQLFV